MENIIIRKTLFHVCKYCDEPFFEPKDIYMSNKNYVFVPIDKILNILTSGVKVWCYGCRGTTYVCQRIFLSNSWKSTEPDVGRFEVNHLNIKFKLKW